ncbi:MAG: hypothetical protein J2P17_29370 [Mycobacterium sp.]|nr:hypothetical protein [Mycobacterium sp.]
MADKLYTQGLNGFLNGTLDWDSTTFSAALVDLDTADTGVKQIASSTNATPIVVTATSHGFSNGDIVVITGHTTNTAANGIWAIAGVATNTFQLTDPITGGNSVGNGVGGATGRAICLGPSASGDNWDDFDGCLVGTKVNLTSPTATAGVADAADVTFTSVSGATVEAVVIFRDTGTASTSTMAAFIDGRQIVTCAATAASSATSVAVERLRGGIPNGTTIAFSNGASATLSSLASAGDRTLTVSSLAAQITAGSRGDAPITGSGLPVTPNGGNITLTFDNGSNKIFAI